VLLLTNCVDELKVRFSSFFFVFSANGGYSPQLPGCALLDTTFLNVA